MIFIVLLDHLGNQFVPTAVPCLLAVVLDRHRNESIEDRHVRCYPLPVIKAGHAGG